MPRRDDLVGPDGWTYSVRFDRAELVEICGHIHWIPMLRGYARDFMSEKHPGWGMNELIGVLRHLDLLVPSQFGGPPSLKKDVEALWLSDRLHAHVERG